MLLLLAAPSLAEPAITLADGPTLFQPCLDEPDCTGYFAPQLAETLAEAGYAMQPDPVATSALGNQGTGVVAEVSVNSTPLGPPNAVQSLYPPVPMVGRLGLGGLLALPHLQLGLGLHGLPRVKLGDGSTAAFGLLASAAWVPLRQLRLGGELGWTRSTFSISLIDSSGDLRKIPELQPYIEKGIECFVDPCVDKLVQHALSARVGLAVEPVPFLFGYVRGGVVSQSQELSIALDGSAWKLSPVSPELSLGAGVRAAELWQLSLGLAMAQRPVSASTSSRSMLKLGAATSVLLGPRSAQ
jgi:hypothetical protein